MSKKEERKKAETARRIAAGDTSSYVQKSAKKYGLKVPTKTTYNPNKISNVIKETMGLSGRDAHLANRAFEAQKANNAKIVAQHAKRRAVEEAFARNGSVSRGDFTGNMGDGIFGLNINATPTGRPKLREGLTSAQYHDWMRKLNKLNRPMMEQLFPWGSGKTARNIITKGALLPIKGASALYSGINALTQPLKNKFGNYMSGIGDTKIIRDLKNAPKGFTEDFTDMITIGDSQDKVDESLSLDMTSIKNDKLNANGSGAYLANKFGIDQPAYDVNMPIINQQEGALQGLKKGGIVSLYQGGPLDRKVNALGMGLGGLYGQGGIFGQGGGPKQWPPRIQQPWHPQQPAPWEDFGETLGGYGEQLGGFGETLGGYGEQIGGFGEQLGGYEDVLGGYGKDLSSFKETMGGFGNQFENINKKLSSMEEGIASLSDKIGTAQGNTQPQRRSNFGFNSYNPWMFGGFGRFGYG
jgi:hypothetical protein